MALSERSEFAQMPVLADGHLTGLPRGLTGRVLRRAERRGAAHAPEVRRPIVRMNEDAEWRYAPPATTLITNFADHGDYGLPSKLCTADASSSKMSNIALILSMSSW